MYFLSRKIDPKNPKCHHGQLDQNVILDKSIWTLPFLLGLFGDIFGGYFLLYF
jgi:hypothetical protein